MCTTRRWLLLEMNLVKTRVLGLWRMKRWMWPWAAVYAAQVAIAMGVFGARQGSLLGGLIPFAVFLVPTVALYRAKEHFSVD